MASFEKSLVYVSILNSNNLPVYTINNEDDRLSLEFQLMLFASIDQFDILKHTSEAAGGYLGSSSIDDDLYYCYGHTFGSRIKVVVITKNHQSTDKDKQEIKRVTSMIHDMYVNDRLNPLSGSVAAYSNNFDQAMTKILN